ncbi:hypothetical protein ABEF95_005080 [Exophiala dermatitidis]
MKLKSYTSENVFLHIPPSLAQRRMEQKGRNDDGGHHDDGGDRSTRLDNFDRQLQASRESTLTLVFFITGNPGLIGYYRPFLSRIAKNLKDEQKDQGSRGNGREPVVVAGFSLGGFEVESVSGTTLTPERQQGGRDEGDEENQDKDSWLRELLDPSSSDEHVYSQPKTATRKQNGSGSEHRLYSLQDQIELSYARVERLVSSLSSVTSVESNNEEEASTRSSCLDDNDKDRNSSSPSSSGNVHVRNGNGNVNVILMGHSVGAYIALEIVRLWNERKQHSHSHNDTNTTTQTQTYDHDHNQAASSKTTTASTFNNSNNSSSKVSTWTPIACILLTPTIINIHESPSGRLATPLLTTSYLSIPNLAQILVHLQTSLLPRKALSWLIQKVTNQKQNSHGLETTLTFLTKCPMGVKQALYMAGDEMREIRGDKWGEEVWGAAAATAATASPSTSTSTSTSSSKQSLTKSTPSPRLYFWFAKSDHWVADLTKQEIQEIKLGGGVVEKDCFRFNIPGINDYDHDHDYGNATATAREEEVQFKQHDEPNQAPMTKIFPFPSYLESSD